MVLGKWILTFTVKGHQFTDERDINVAVTYRSVLAMKEIEHIFTGDARLQAICRMSRKIIQGQRVPIHYLNDGELDAICILTRTTRRSSCTFAAPTLRFCRRTMLYMSNYC